MIDCMKVKIGSETSMGQRRTTPHKHINKRIFDIYDSKYYSYAEEYMIH